MKRTTTILLLFIASFLLVSCASSRKMSEPIKESARALDVADSTIARAVSLYDSSHFSAAAAMLKGMGTRQLNCFMTAESFQ